jgi:hypothetical protein
VVMDAGIATEANLAWLKQHGYQYLVVRGCKLFCVIGGG